MGSSGKLRPAHGWIRLDKNGRIRHADTDAQAVLGDHVSSGELPSLRSLLGNTVLPPHVFVRCSVPQGAEFLARSHPIRSGGMHIELFQLGDPISSSPHATQYPSDARLVAQCMRWHIPTTRRDFYTTTDAIAIYGWEKPALLAANIALCNQLEASEQALIGKCVRDLTPRTASDLVDRTSLAQHQDGRTKRPCPIVTRSGTVWMELTLVRYQVEGKNYQAAMYTSNDNRPADSLITVNPADIMANADRLSLMGQLANGVAHEMSTPASWVLGNLTLLGQELGDDHPQRHLIHESLAGMQRISALMNTLRAFGSTNSAPHVPIQVNTFVEEALALVGNTLRHNAVLSIDLGDAGQVMGNPNQLMQVMANLLTNASQALDPKAPQHFIRVTTFSKDNQAVIEVSDTGTGIPDDIRDRIFEPFFTTRPFGEASGLGLAAALQITTAHKGSLAVESNTLGSRFRVRLPKHEPHCTSSNAIAWTPGLYGNRILVIDDEPMLLRVVQRLLRRIATIEVATGGQDAINRLKQEGAFDLVLCDLMMPGVDGPQVYEWIEQNLPEMIPRTHFLSGGAFTKESIAFLRDRKINMVNKPVSPSKLIALATAHVAPKD